MAAPLEDASAPAAGRGRDRRLVPFAAGGLALGLVLGALAAGLLRRPADRPLSWLLLDLAPADHLADGRPRFHAFALSPDGRWVAFAGERAGRTDLYLRALDRAEATAVPGTTGAASPFFSPDGRWLGFLADDALKKVAVDGDL